MDDKENPSMVRIPLKKSKCDQFGSGVDVVLGRVGTTLCPVSALLHYIAARGATPSWSLLPGH